MIPALMPTYGRYDLAFERGEGAYLYTAEGEGYLDFGTGIAVCGLGHAHPHLVQALQAQAGKLWHCSNLYQIPEQQRLAERLVQVSFADSVFFSNSGAEAMEGALKMVRRYHSAKGQPGRYRAVAMTQAFHGRTLATIAAGDSAKARQGFEPMVDGFDRVPFGNLNEVRAAIGPETGAILVEPIQGEGGIRTGSAEFLRDLRAAADEFGLLLIFDEIQSGMGRTGHLFAYEAAGISPDIMTLAKGMGGGFPVGAILATEEAAAAMTPGSHGSTFGGNPLAMAVAHAVLDVMLAPGFLAHVQQISAVLDQRLQALVAKHPGFYTEQRGAGLMRGLVCGEPNNDVIQRLNAAHLLTAPAADNVIRLLPPLIIGEAEIDAAVTILDQVASAWSQPQNT